MTVTEETAARRGRPRSPETIARDRRVLHAIVKSEDDGVTRHTIHQRTGLTEVQVYQSLRRLRRRDLVFRTRESVDHVWRSTQMGRHMKALDEVA